MFNPFLILYYIVIAFFLGGVVVVTYHLVKYQLNKKVTMFTLWLFLGGAAIFLLFNIAIALQINWSQYSIIF